ncbi:MAG: NUDIX domain-containing protein [Candidatus Kerfeldbacteria bacterium]|nr:NUDIX domain-containing protein [Candidatus Kerfeldbacteria bacterium]
MPRRPRQTASSITIHHSCGVIPLRRTRRGFEFLLIQHVGGKHWSFPKGHAETGETEQQTARRELAEETGLHRCRLLGPKFLERYTWRGTDGRHRKSVTFFVGLILGGRVMPQAEEVRDWRWLRYPDARRLITYRESKKLIDRVWRTVHTTPSLTAQHP